MFGFGDAGFVAGFGGFFAYHAVDEGGLADVGDAADEDAQGFVYALAVGNHGAAGLGDFAVCAGFGGIEGDGAGVGAAVVVFEPDFGALGIGKVLFVEDFEFGFAFGSWTSRGFSLEAGIRASSISITMSTLLVRSAMAFFALFMWPGNHWIAMFCSFCLICGGVV